MGFSNYETKLEQAAKEVIDGFATGYTSLTGIDAATKPNSYILLLGEKGSEAPLNSGNYHGKLTVEVRDTADTVAEAVHRARAGSVFDAFLEDALATMLSDAVDDFTILLITSRDGSATRVEDRHWVSSISIGVYGCCSDVN